MIISHDPAYLEDCRQRIEVILKELKFEINPAKTKIYPLSGGIDFLGFQFSLTATGKVLMQIRPSNVKAERKKLFRLVQKCLRGEMPRSAAENSYKAWRTHASKGNSYRLIQRMDAYYQSLWAEGVYT